MTDKPTPLTPQSNQPRSATWTALGLVWEFGYVIAVPLIGFALIGRWLDRRFDTSPWFLLIGMAVAVAVTTIFLIRKFATMMRNMNGGTKS